MLTVLDGESPEAYPSIHQQMFALRAHAFKQRRGWTVDVENGIERDRFDDLKPAYLISLNETGRVVACLRLLQTTGPHMLSDVFPETMSGGTLIRHPLIWESTRFCVDTKNLPKMGAGGVHAVTGELLTGLFELAVSIGLLNVISVYDLMMERVLRRAGCRFERLGLPHEYDGLPTVAGVFEVSADSVANIRQRSGISYDVFIPEGELAGRLGDVAA